MEALIWNLRTRADGVPQAYLSLLLVCMVMFWDYPVLLLISLWTRALGASRAARRGQALPPVLVVIPSLLRNRDELTSMRSTLRSICGNGYPGQVLVVVSIDGCDDAPPLYTELVSWAKNEPWPDGAGVRVTGTPKRHGKPMAIEHAVSFVKQLVLQKSLPSFPPVYVSTDADADLGPAALEAIVRRLYRRSWLTGQRPNVVAGALHVRGNGYWSGWRNFLTERGQLSLQVAREYYVSNVGRHNLRAIPVTGVPGAFYCTWSALFVSIPRFLGYLQTLRREHWLLWWLGDAPPSFVSSRAPALPELMAGDTDDTVTAYVATLARADGKGGFSLEAPRTPLHALWQMLLRVTIERPLKYEPKARVYTSSPDTAKALFKQRRRWNASRLELTLRLWPALSFHWCVGVPALVVLGFLGRGFVSGLLAYVVVPLFFFRDSLFAGFLLVYSAQLLVALTLTLISLVINDELEAWRLLLAVPLVPAYNFLFNWLPAATGLFNDVFLFGNVTGFSPEWTLKLGGSVRIALLFRVRRAFWLLVRSVVVGDVPLGSFWLGWGETRWTPSGFEGWTTGKTPRRIFPVERAPRRRT
jgi:cellulose synthase/poly-beta-1,6-N-acetylglucosamine synthase-like glycosyltransferase